MNTVITKVVLCLCLVLPSLGARLPYIIGGENANIMDFPWQCSLRNHFGSHKCGASIISSTWLVSAAHCMGSASYVYCGSGARTYGGIEKAIITYIKHEDYGSGPGSFPNDIAAIQVSELPMDGPKIKAIPMWDSADGEPAGNNDCWITGWGLTTTGGGGSLPVFLQKAHINVHTQHSCISIMGSTINDGHVCVGDSVNGRGSCTGDSGGPLVCKKDGEYKLVGATSWGDTGCYTAYPSVYSRISYFREWIRGKTGL